MKFTKNLLMLLMLPAFALPVIAQDSEDEDEGLEIVITTAQKVEKDVMDTPVPVTVFTQDKLTEYGINNYIDLSQMVPMLEITDSSNHGAPVITMRGVRSNNVTELGDPAVGVHVDGVYVSRMQGAMALLFDLERAEVLRGPQGTLYGRNSTVGTFNVVTAKPNFEVQGGSVTIDAGRMDAQALRMHYNLPITDNFAIRLAYMEEKKDSFITTYLDASQMDHRFMKFAGVDLSEFSQIGGDYNNRYMSDHHWYNGFDGWQQRPLSKVQMDPADSYNNVDQNAFRLSALYDMGGERSLNVQFEQYENQNAHWTETPACELMRGRPAVGYESWNWGGFDITNCDTGFGGGNAYEVFVNTPGMLDVALTSTRAIYKGPVGDFDLVAKYGYQHLEEEAHFDTDMGHGNWDGNWNIDDFVAKAKVFDIELRSSKDEKLQWVVGYFMNLENNNMEAHFNGLEGSDVFIQPDRQLDATAMYGQATYQLDERMFLTLGARYSEEEKTDVGGRNFRCMFWANGCAADPYGGARARDPNWVRLGYTPWKNGGEFLVEGVNCTGGYGCLQEVLINDTSAEFENLDYRVGLDFDLDDNTLLYAYYATGFKSGSIQDVYRRGDNTLHPEGPGSYADTSYDNEYIDTFEFGFKRRVGKDLNLSFNAYFSQYDGKQESGNVPVDVISAMGVDTSIGSPTFGQMVQQDQVVTRWSSQNFGEQEFYGSEFEFDWNPYEGGNINGYIATMNTKVTESFVTQVRYAIGFAHGRPDYGSAVAPEPENNIDLLGNEAPYAPQFQTTIRYEHTFNTPVGKIKPQVQYHYETSAYLSIYNIDKHVDDEGGYGTYGCTNFGAADGCAYDFIDLPGYWAQPAEYLSDLRPAFETFNLLLTFEPAEGSWYAQAYSYNAMDERIPYHRAWEGAVPRGGYSGPAQYGIRFGYFW